MKSKYMLVALLALASCAEGQASPQAPPPPPATSPSPGQIYQPAPGAPPNQIGAQPNATTKSVVYGLQAAPYAQAAPVMQPQRPLLPPLIGSIAMQTEVRSVLSELIAALPAMSRSHVSSIPLVFDSSVEVNAYAGCNDRGEPFLAGTQGLLDAVDAIAQTKATDELFGTQTYEAYVNAVVPDLARSTTARAVLPFGIIPLQYGVDPRRWSRARELFDEIIAFTYGHELSHHYLGHTGCANGQPAGLPNLAQLGQAAQAIVPGVNQPNEIAADAAGMQNALDAGLARRPSARWREYGGFWLLDFFSRIERASGANPLSPQALFLRTHPNPGLRLPIVQGVAQHWYSMHPGVSGT